MTSKIGFKYDEFHSDLIQCLDYSINQSKFEERWNSIIDNKNYSEARSYLEALNQWRERWALAYFKDFFLQT